MWPIKTAPDSPTLGIASPAHRFGADPALSLRVSTPRHCPAPGYRMPTPVGPVYSASDPRCDRPLAVGHKPPSYSTATADDRQPKVENVEFEFGGLLQWRAINPSCWHKKKLEAVCLSRGQLGRGGSSAHRTVLVCLAFLEGRDSHASPAYPGSLNRELRLQLFYTRA